MTETLPVDKYYFVKIIVSAAVAVAILTFDSSLQLGVAGGVPYVVLVGLGIWFHKIRDIYILAVAGSVLTMFGYFFSPEGGALWIVLTNRGLAMFAIWVMALVIISRLRAEEALRRASEFTGTSLDALVDTFFVFSPETGKALLWNKAFRDISGYSDSEIAEMKAPESYYDEEDLVKAACTTKQIMEHGVGNIEMSLVCKDGQRIPTEYTASLVEGHADQLPWFVSVGRNITDRKAAENLLRDSLERFTELSDLIPQPVWETNLDGIFTYSNRIGFQQFGYTQDDMEKGVRADELFATQERPRILKELAQLLAGEEITRNEYLCQRKDGSNFPAWIYASRIYRDGMPVGIRGITLDISERKQVENELMKLGRAVEASSSAVIISNAEHIIEYINPKLTEITGYREADIIGYTSSILKSRETPEEVYSEITQAIRSKGEWKGDLHNRRKDGSLYWARNSISSVKDEDGVVTHYISIHEDVTDELELKRQLSYQASHDALTGLINRHEFERRAERLISTFKPGEEEHALCFMDLDQFKVINDTCGHTAGDELLRQLSQILQGAVRHRDTLARLGGDEFGVLIEHCSLNQAQRVATSLQSVIQDSKFTWEGHAFPVGASIGLVAINEFTPDLTELLRQADASCYMAKDLGRNRIHVYHPEDTELVQRHGEMQWVQRINRALETDQFCLYTQPIVPLDNSGHRHYEMLLRMIDDNGDIIPPGAFLPAAERYDLIGKLDRWVVENALALLAENPAFVDEISFISINLSGQSVTSGNFLDFIMAQLKKTGIDADRICFEITETVAISNLSAAITFIEILKDIGCQFALDDFGSGLSSFGYLKNLSVNYLKIDGMFVKGIVDDPIDYAMVKSINDIGQVMGMKTIAEFVENDEIRGMLREIGVNYVQGYGVGVPLPFSEVI